MSKLSTFIIALLSLSVFSQEQLTLNECYQLLNTNYPLAKQSALLENQNALDLEVIKTEKLPKIDFLAQATYQSDVIEIPIPNAGIESLNKDQYRATLSVNQLIYGGGIVNASLNAKSVALKAQQKQVEVSLYQLKKQVNQLYFSILLAQEKRGLLIEKEKQLNAKLKEVRSGIKNGLLLPTSDKVIEAELLKINQQFLEINLNKESLINSLSSLIGKEIETSSNFENPMVSTELDNEITRPELELFQLKKEQIKTSEALISKENSPKLMGFATGGYGNPGLNMLDNSFQGFYTVGIKLNWNVFDWNTTKKKRESLSVNKDIIDNEAEIFTLNTNIELSQQQSEIKKLEGFIISDLEIIKLRKDVLKSAESQLRNGVITPSAYIIELTNLYEDENNLNTHKVQLLFAKANYNITKGN
ncbi:MAG: TolC family protein [Flavobacteriaceae bacterium]|nr:TolC family protein [Flavobacteriaceae bacterium]